MLTTDYAGFWSRAAAHFVDNMLIGVVLWIFKATAIDPNGYIGLVLVFLYYVGLEGSSKQGTLGKQAMNLRVADKNGNRVSYFRAFARFAFMMVLPLVIAVLLGVLIEIVSGTGNPVAAGAYIMIIYSAVFLLQCLLVAWTPKKQALHDLLSGCIIYKHSKDLEARRQQEAALPGQD